MSLDPTYSTHEVLPSAYVVVTGTMGDGFYFYGPFLRVFDAHKWINEKLIPGTHVQIVPLNLARGV